MSTKSQNRKTPLNEAELQVCQRLRELWNARATHLRMTQEIAAERMGISQGAVGHFLQGRNRLHVEAVFWFADLLQVHPLDIDPALPERLPGNLRLALTYMPARLPPAGATATYPQAKASAPAHVHEPPPAGGTTRAQ